MGMGFAPTWLRQVSPPASQNHFNHWTIFPWQFMFICAFWFVCMSPSFYVSLSSYNRIHHPYTTRMFKNYDSYSSSVQKNWGFQVVKFLPGILTLTLILSSTLCRLKHQWFQTRHSKNGTKTLPPCQRSSISAYSFQQRCWSALSIGRPLTA